jgi:hypothetical protein
MAQQSMLMGLLKTPSQVRQEQQDRLMQESLARSQQMITGGGTTALPGIISRYGAQAAQRGAMAGAGLLRGVAGGLGTAVGGDMGQRIADLGVTAEERQARRYQEATSGLQMGNVNSMKEALKRLQDAGAPLQAQLALSEAIAKREKEILDRASGARGEQLQRDMFGLKEREVELEEAKFEAEKTLGGALGDFDLTTEDGVNKAVETLMKGGKVAEAVRLKNAFRKEKSTLEKRIQYLADNFTDGDLQAAYDMALEEKREAPLLAPTAERLEADHEKAISTRNRMNTANDALKILDSGDVNIGSFAKTRQGAQKFLQQVFGLDDDGAVARTELLLARVKRLGGEALASGMFGTGTAISDQDLKTAMSIAGGDESLTPEGMRAVIKANMAVDMIELDKYNERVNRLGDAFWEKSFYSKDAYTIQAPEIYSEGFTIDRAERSAQNADNLTIYEFRGKWYNADGSEYTP